MFPTFVPDAETTLEPLSAGEALVALVPCSFAGTWFVDGALDRVVDLAEHVPAYRLTFGDLARATRLIREAVGSSVGPPMTGEVRWLRIRRVLDRVVAAIATIVTAPVVAIIAILIRRDDGGPPIIRVPTHG